MDQSARRTRVLAAIALCLSMMSGMMVVLPENGAAVPLDGYIVGNVSDGTDPLPGSLVYYMAMYGGFEGGAWTDSLGDYSIAAPGGLDYYLMAFNDSCYAGVTYVSVASGETSVVDFTLQDIAPAVTDVTVTGYLWDEYGSPVPDTVIGAYSADPATMGDGPPMYINMTRTDGSGMFVVDILPSIAGAGIVALDVPGYPMCENATEDPVISGNTYWINLTMQPLEYGDDATISGTVTDLDTGLPLENVMVTTESWDESADEGSNNITWTGPDGHYVMDIKSGEVRVIMSLSGYTMYMEDGIEVLPGEDEVVDAALRATTAVIRGNVTDYGSGLPIEMARVFLFDMSNGTMNMAFTDDSGAYVLEAFDGSDLVLGAETEGYGAQYIMISVDIGDELWYDFALAAVDAEVAGYVTDAITGLPIEGASVHFYAWSYERWEDTDPSGHYDMAIVSGDYTVEVYAPDYRYTSFDVSIYPGYNVVDIELMPQNLPDTVLLYGTITDAVTTDPISYASVEAGSGALDGSEYNSTSADFWGYYEMYLPQMEMVVIFSAPDHEHFEVWVDASEGTDITVDVQLEPDLAAPYIDHYSQSPTENVSWFNTAWISVDVFEQDPRSAALWQFMENGTGSGWSYYYAIETLYNSFNPLEQSMNNLPWWGSGDGWYFIDYFWSAQPQCGWLTDGVSSKYMQYFDVWMGPDQYSGLRGHYMNSTLSSPAEGTAWFDGISGAFSFFSFDNGSMEPAMAGDPSGVVTAFGAFVRAPEGTDFWEWMGTQPLGEWSVVGLMLQREWIAPSGDYATLFFVNDWSGRTGVEFTLFTVDTDPPVADAGKGQTALLGAAVKLDGSLSEDNFGIKTYMWSFVDGGETYLYGEVVYHNFLTLGNHTVTLTVYDGGGHTDISTTWVNVTDDLPPVADAGPDQDVPIGMEVLFDGGGSSDDDGIVNYTWTIVELSKQMWGQTPMFVFSYPGVYTVSLVVEDTMGQHSSPDTMLVTARDIIVPIAAAGDDVLDGQGGVVMLLDGSDSWDDIGIVYWNWSFEHMGVPEELSGETVEFTFWEAGVYVITLNVTDAAGNWDTDEVVVEITTVIPEFPSVVLPVTGALLVVLFAVLRRRRD